MTLTTEQRERLVGMVMMGMRSETACECLGVSPADVLATEDADQSFAQALYMARFTRDAFERELESLAEDEG